ncbi:hypothetical protein [Xanthomonas phaseoli]|uniref:hypothetical protein n=1 Tax=Xanthomonas phaseoli TaxID=1985254 RepID=UPI000AABAA6B|nr:hypothetical protein [Xanthomonas phaseoli]
MQQLVRKTSPQWWRQHTAALCAGWPDVAVERAMTAVEATHVRLTRITQVVFEDALLCARIAFIELRRR